MTRENLAQSKNAKWPMRLAIITIIVLVVAILALLGRKLLPGSLKTNPVTPTVRAPVQAVPTAQTEAADMQQAFKVVFPSPQTKSKDGANLLFEPVKFVPLDDQTFALLATGRAVSEADTCHACSGALRVTYLGSRLQILDPPVGIELIGNDFGEPPEWKLMQIEGKPTLEITTGGMTQGCVYGSTSYYRLDQRSITELKELGKSETC
jgi:hypothetical protein